MALSITTTGCTIYSLPPRSEATNYDHEFQWNQERTFAWQDTYRKLVISYDRLKETRKGFRLLAYSMINFRVTFNHR